MADFTNTRSSDPFAKQENVDNKFKNSRGLYLTTSMFIEHNYDYSLAVYSWGDQDFKNDKGSFPSLKRLYLEMGDVTEYEFANTYLDGWRHWKTLLESPGCRKHIDEWREELDLKLRSAGLRKLIDQALDDEKPSYQAAKYLADREWVSKRQKSQEGPKETRQRKKLSQQHKDNFDRVSKLIK